MAGKGKFRLMHNIDFHFIAEAFLFGFTMHFIIDYSNTTMPLMPINGQFSFFNYCLSSVLSFLFSLCSIHFLGVKKSISRC